MEDGFVLFFARFGFLAKDFVRFQRERENFVRFQVTAQYSGGKLWRILQKVVIMKHSYIYVDVLNIQYYVGAYCTANQMDKLVKLYLRGIAFNILSLLELALQFWFKMLNSVVTLSPVSLQKNK